MGRSFGTSLERTAKMRAGALPLPLGGEGVGEGEKALKLTAPLPALDPDFHAPGRNLAKSGPAYNPPNRRCRRVNSSRASTKSFLRKSGQRVGVTTSSA